MVLLIGIFSFVAILGTTITTRSFTDRGIVEAQRLETY